MVDDATAGGAVVKDAIIGCVIMDNTIIGGAIVNSASIGDTTAMHGGNKGWQENGWTSKGGKYTKRSSFSTYNAITPID
jgi:hypothetical protein